MNIFARSPRASRQLFSAVVGLSGLEPPTSRLSGARSNLLSYKPSCFVRSISIFPALTLQLALGGDDGIRTHDPLLAGQVLSQLSYTPVWCLLSSFAASGIPV